MRKLIVLFIVLLSNHVFAQNSDQHIIQLLKEKDSLFWVGYNTCNLNLLSQFVANDLVFYHDKGGMTSGLENFKKRVQQNICGDANNKVRRELVPGTFKLYLLKNEDKIYGAVASCDHYFYHSQNGAKESSADVAKFMGLWLLKDGEWKMHQIFSFNHEPTTDVIKSKAHSK